MITEKMDHLNKIVEQILDFARPTEPQMAAVNLNKLIEELGLLVRHKLKNQNVQVLQRLQPALPAVMAEATQLEQAFLNLILNAAEAMPKGGTLTITSRAVRLPRNSSHPTHVAVDVKDTGLGMTEQVRRRAFTSVLSSSKNKGTGLGLAIVRRILETHRGRLRIKSFPGFGTTVTVILPV